MRLGAAGAFGMLACLASACSLGEGEGDIRSDTLNVAECWNGPFDLTPDFFAAQPYRQTALTIRVQHGGDTEEVSDGAIFLVDDINKIRAGIAANPNASFKVGLPPSVVPPGFPIVADPDPPLVHVTLYLHRSCHAQNSALYSVSGTIVFHSIFDGDPNETDAAQKLTDAEFTDIVVGDPRNRQPASNVIEGTSLIRGNFKFYFQRGQPAQPFP
jgi:hypothetical protein